MIDDPHVLIVPEVRRRRVGALVPPSGRLRTPPKVRRNVSSVRGHVRSESQVAPSDRKIIPVSERQYAEPCSREHMTETPTVMLANGVAMPAIGFGTSPMGDAEAEQAVAAALRAGYRLIDTAENYRNEAGVGRGIRSSGVDRDEIFVTTKLNKRWHGEAEAHQAFSNSAERLGLASASTSC